MFPWPSCGFWVVELFGGFALLVCLLIRLVLLCGFVFGFADCSLFSLVFSGLDVCVGLELFGV